MFIVDIGSVTTLAGSLDGASGDTDGTGNSARFYNPWGVFGYNGDIVIADSWNNVIRKLTTAGTVYWKLLASCVCDYVDQKVCC